MDFYNHMCMYTYTCVYLYMMNIYKYQCLYRCLQHGFGSAFFRCSREVGILLCRDVSLATSCSSVTPGSRYESLQPLGEQSKKAQETPPTQVRREQDQSAKFLTEARLTKWVQSNSRDSWVLHKSPGLLAGWLAGALARWLARWLALWLAGWLAGLLACWLARLLACWLARLLACWLAGWLLGRGCQTVIPRWRG